MSPQGEKRIVLVEDIPYLFGTKQEEQFGEIINNFIQTTSNPLVLILTTESNNFQSTNILPSSILSSPLVTIIKYPRH